MYSCWTSLSLACRRSTAVAALSSDVDEISPISEIASAGGLAPPAAVLAGIDREPDGKLRRGILRGARLHHWRRRQQSRPRSMACTSPCRARHRSRSHVLSAPTGVSASSISSRASAAESSRRLRSFSRHRRINLRIGAGVSDGSAVNRAHSSTPTRGRATPSAAGKHPPAGQHFQEHDPKGPGGRCAGRQACRPPVQDSYAAVPRITPTAVIPPGAAGLVMVGEFASASDAEDDDATGSRAFARPSPP